MPARAISSTPIAAYQDWAIEKGIGLSTEPTIFQLFLRTVAKFQLAAEGHGDRQPPEPRASGSRPISTRCRLVSALRGRRWSRTAYPLHAITQRPMRHVPFLGLAECVAAADHGENPLYVPRSASAGVGRRRLGLGSSHTAREIRVPGAADGRRERTRSGPGTPSASARAPGPGQGCAGGDAGFLLNHLISELAAAQGRWLRYSNSDPITGQAAWFDLRVSIEKADGPGERACSRRWAARSARAGKWPSERGGGTRMTSLPKDTEKSSASSSTSTPASAAMPA
jgi:hypothetical protein